MKSINLDKIPGLDDFDDPVPTFTAPKPSMPLPGASKTQAKPPGAAEEGGGLLGGLTGGLTQGLSGLTGGGAPGGAGGVGGVAAGITGKLGDLAGSATSAGGGLLSSGKGLFKKFGF